MMEIVLKLDFKFWENFIFCILVNIDIRFVCLVIGFIYIKRGVGYEFILKIVMVIDLFF